ncbi:alpha-glucan family phosphorylase [Candidatus Parcubacteria bacterium]|nr:alpha-glucan family phosphorylase [Patescibacteria group bacterium]MCG2688737.1 alpha-glucan family phosphorylase [Candidatus Parcubacteria bacterium]
MKSEEVSLNSAAHNYNNWFDDFKTSPEHDEFFKKPVAYFCTEYALFSYLPTYAGGLGVLAGDYVREAGARQFPLLSVGLYYREAQNSLTPPGYSNNVFLKGAGLSLVTNSHNERLFITFPIHDRMVKAQAWRWDKEGSTVYLLDTDVEENQPPDRSITARLYTDDREMRLKQEMLLGIGGFRLLEQLGYHCSVYHLNEGHSAFLALELIRHEMKHQRVDFYTAIEYARKHIIFTNHTLIAAGQEQFTIELVSAIMSGYAKEIEVNVADIVGLGTIKGSNLFSMTTFSFCLASRINMVSKLHATKALEIWPGHPIKNVTNGIYLPQWDKISNSGNAKASAGRDFWEKHQESKKKLLSYIKDKTGEAWNENTLLFGWARRLVPYKRPLVFLESLEKLLALAKNVNKPMRIVFAGPTNNENETNNDLLVQLKKILEEKLKGIGVFLPNYNVELAKLITAGCDVWLNTPVVGSEACGTSGMKAALNGALLLSTRDGWVDEVNLSAIGWVVDEPNVGVKMLDIAEKEIIPAYYDHITNPNGSKWLTRMQNGRRLITEQFSTSRVLKQYIEEFYIPILCQKHEHKYE